jgi:hypothetical protein
MRHEGYFTATWYKNTNTQKIYKGNTYLPIGRRPTSLGDVYSASLNDFPVLHTSHSR